MKFIFLLFSTILVLFLPIQAFCSHNIISAEYYIDNDPGEGNGNPLYIKKGLFFKDNFDSENNNVGELNYTSFANWTVDNGAVDLVGEGFVYDGVDFDFWPGNGQYVDLDGTTDKAGTFITKTTFNLLPGKYTLEFSLAGSNRGDTNTVTVSLGNIYNETFTKVSDEPFEKISREINVFSTIKVRLSFAHTGNDQYGLLLDNVQLSTQNETIWSEFSAEISLPQNITIGPHYLFLRMKNENNQWSFSRKHLFIVDGTKTINQAEYFIDNDPGEGKGSALSMEDNNTFQLSSIDTSSLSVGVHNIYVRMRNSESQWGPPRVYQFEVTEEPFIKQAEYFIDNDPGKGNGYSLNSLDGSFDEFYENLTGEINTTYVSYGKHNLFVRAMDSYSIWGEPIQIIFESREHSNPSISGNVKFSIGGWSNLSLKNAEVALQGTDFYTSTDDNGKFTFLDVPEGDYILSINAPGFDEFTKNISWSGGESFNLDIPPILLGGCGLKGDFNNDDKIDLKEAIHALQISTQFTQ